MAPRRRSAAVGPRVSLRNRRTSTPATPKIEEEEEEQQIEDEQIETPAAADDEVDPDEDATPQEEADDDDEEEEDDASLPNSRRSHLSQPPPKKRGPGRPRIRDRPPDWDTPGSGNDEASDGTPRRVRGGRRGGFRGGVRGRRGRGVPPAGPLRVPIDKEGNTLEVRDDEVMLPPDPEGEKKVDIKGNLQGGREYRVRTFTILGRDERLYMLSTEPARCTGFRDSYLFFTKHPTLFKIILNDEEKLDLIDRNIMPHSYKGRAIGVVTARSVFREFGARIVVGGKRIIDDYKVQQAKELGAIEGQVADPNDMVPRNGEEYNRNQYVAWHGASQVYHSNQPNAPVAQQLLGRRKRVAITSNNWMYEHAIEASRFNSELVAARRTTFGGTYDTHTNLMHFPKHMQPSVARWERVEVEDEEPPTKKLKVNGINGLTNGISNHDDDVDMSDAHTAKDNTEPPKFPAVSRLLARNFLITDTYFQLPPHASFPLPGPSPFTDAEVEEYAIPRRSLPDLTEADMADWPEDCRAAFRAVKRDQAEWVSAWSTEAHDGAREALKIGFGL